ncbi:hypothetical protein RJ640_026105 [Escallonia rubra]|uniref:Uncharacterized protein n=1 Tax=Escallonia rubra TaxID=112253 RepID=A0AA88RFJ1_9ASTE|nr:hypothetical protein RJ640_026105 [Escallonia rubra]
MTVYGGDKKAPGFLPGPVSVSRTRSGYPWLNNDIVGRFIECIELAKNVTQGTFDDELSQQTDGPLPSWDDASGVGDAFDDGNAYSDVEDSSTLVSQPRQFYITFTG